jgi:hypothetical protein
MPAGPSGKSVSLSREVDGERRAEIGWRLAREFWGRGYATEAPGAKPHSSEGGEPAARTTRGKSGFRWKKSP